MEIKAQQQRTKGGKRTSEPNHRQNNKSLAGQTDWASECRAIPVMKKGGNISLSLLISCAGRDTTQLMASAVISYLHLLLHSHLDLSQTEHILVMKHSSQSHSSQPWWSIPSPPLSLSLTLTTFMQLCFVSPLNHDALSIWMSPGHSSRKKKKNHR